MAVRIGISLFVLAAFLAPGSGLAIVGGQVEEDYAAVGAVTDGAGLRATAVLIDPYWILTSANVATSISGGTFHVGTDSASPDASYAISDFFPHPFYDPTYGENDIALARLTTPVTDVSPIPCLSTSSALMSGSMVRFVGYGWTTLLDSGNTVRHSCSGEVYELQYSRFVTYDGDKGPYFGDTGAPALLDVGGVEYVAGIVSVIEGSAHFYTYCPRVAFYLAFIESVMADNPPPSGVGEMPLVRGSLQVAPNPFNPAARISFRIAKPVFCSLRVYDVTGRLVRTLIAGEILDVGQREAVWDGCDRTGRQAASGTYFCHLETSGFSETKRMVLLK